MTKRCILLKIEIFVLIFAVILSSVTFVMRYKKDQRRILPFYKESSNSFDVIFLGSSHVHGSIIPLELWNNYGITSFDYATPGQNFQLIFSCIKEVIEKQNPTLLVIDLYTSFYICRHMFESFGTHNITDCMSMFSKYRLLKDFISTNNELDNNISFELFFPLSVYHHRWNNLSKDDFYGIGIEEDIRKGVYMDVPYFKRMNKGRLQVTSLKHTESKQLPYLYDTILIKILELCKKEQTNILFTIFPYDDNHKDGSYNIDINLVNQYYKYILEKGINYKNTAFINYFTKINEIGLDGKKDLKDKSHLNYYGAQKITAHIGKYIKEHYDIPDRRLDPAYAKWNDDYKLYVQDTFAQELNATKNSEKYLELLTSKKEATDNTCIFFVKTSEKNINSKHFNSLGINVNTNNCITIIDEGKIVYNRTASDILLQHEYKIGRLPIKLVSDVKGKNSSIKVDGIEQINNKSGITVVIYDKLLKKVSSVRSL